MKPFRDRFGKQNRSKRLKNENTFTVKYLGSASKLPKDIKVVENAVNQKTERALRKDLSYQLLGKHLIHVTEDRVALYPNGKIKEGSDVFSIPVEKLSYGFFPRKRNYQILALNKHVSIKEVETYVVCCKSKEKMLAIKMALYSSFKGKYLARLRKKRIENNVLSNQYFTQQHYIREEPEIPPKNMKHGPPAFSNELINGKYNSQERMNKAILPNEIMNGHSKQTTTEKETAVVIHHQEQKPKHEETAGKQNDFDIITVHPMSKMASSTYKKHSLKQERGFRSSMC